MVQKPMKVHFADMTGGISKCELTHCAVDVCYFSSFGTGSMAGLSRRAVGSLTEGLVTYIIIAVLHVDHLWVCGSSQNCIVKGCAKRITSTFSKFNFKPVLILFPFDVE
jgi:hypothetical protein